MTSSNTLKKFVSIGAALLLAVGGSLVAAQPAQATAPGVSIDAGLTTAWNNATPITWQTGSYSPSMSLKLTMTSSLSSIAKFDVLLSDGSNPISSHGVTSGNNASTNCKVNSWYNPSWETSLSCQVLGGADPGKIRYTPSSPFSLASNDVFIVNYLAEAWDNGGQFAGTKSIQVDFLDSSNTVIGHATGSFSISVPPSFIATLNANGGTLGSVTSVTADSMGSVNFPNPSVPANIPTRSGFNLSGWSANQNATQGSYNTILSSSTTYYAIWVSANPNNNQNNIQNQITPTQQIAPTISIAEDKRPLPTWAAPILKQIPTLSKTLTTDGGKIGLTDGDYSTLKSVTVGGTAVAFSIDAKGDVSIPVPAGKGGTSADLVVTFTGGKMVIQDGIKYVTPTDVSKVAEAPVAGFKANSSKVSGELAASILYAAQVNHKATAIVCTGYAATKAQVALATARAEATCGYATNAYDNLTKSTVAVIVNKKMAKLASVGIKVHN